MSMSDCDRFKKKEKK